MTLTGKGQDRKGFPLTFYTRANRRRATCSFASTVEKREETSPTEALKSRLVALDIVVRSFVTNPVFIDANVDNTELAGKAKGELDEIIRLCDMVRKQALKLDKASGKSH